ncbi:MAG: AMP-binding protein [Desulfobacterales bacterium]
MTQQWEGRGTAFGYRSMPSPKHELNFKDGAMKNNEAWYEYPSNLVDLFEDSVKKFAERPFVGMKNADGEYEFSTYGQVAERVDNLRGGLAQLGVDKGDAVGLIINNSEAWTVIAFCHLWAGGAPGAHV